MLQVLLLKSVSYTVSPFLYYSFVFVTALPLAVTVLPFVYSLDYILSNINIIFNSNFTYLYDSTTFLSIFCSYVTKHYTTHNIMLLRQSFLFSRAFLHRIILTNAHKLFVYRSGSYSDKCFKVGINLP